MYEFRELILNSLRPELHHRSFATKFVHNLLNCFEGMENFSTVKCKEVPKHCYVVAYNRGKMTGTDESSLYLNPRAGLFEF